MGQKINPHGLRLGPVFSWDSRWYADNKHYRLLLLKDIKLREMLFARLKPAGLSHVDIERSINKIKVILNVSRPGVVIGRGGSGLEEIKKFIENFLINFKTHQNPYLNQKDDGLTQGKTKVEVAVEPVKEPNLSAFLVGINISDQIVRRLPHKRVCNQALERVMTGGAKGVRILLSGRINGAEIARREKFQQGTVPLSTIKENIDFASVPALTKSGYVGVKVWICKKSL